MNAISTISETQSNQPRKVFSIALEFHLGSNKTSKTRLRAAYDAAIEAAVLAVQAELLEDSIETATSNMAYDYRYLARSEEVPVELIDEEHGLVEGPTPFPNDTD